MGTAKLKPVTTLTVSNIDRGREAEEDPGGGAHFASTQMAVFLAEYTTRVRTVSS